jgi:hypothetical protein
MSAGNEMAEGIVEAGEWFGIGNEFTGVNARKVFTRNGERLQLQVPAKNYDVLLDAMQLEIIAAQDPEQFSWLFQRKLGSDGSSRPE